MSDRRTSSRPWRYVVFAFGISIILSLAAAEGPLWFVAMAVGASVVNAYLAATEQPTGGE